MRRLILLALLCLTGCAAKAPMAAIDAETVLKEPESKANVPAKTMNDFAFRLAHHAISADSKQNELISPLSVSVCLSMLANGANGSTRDLIAETLGIEASELEGWNAGNQTLVQSLLQGKKVDLSLANSLWTFKDMPPRPDYVNLLERYYGAKAFSLEDRDQAGIDKINEWTRRNTRGRIPSIINGFTDGSFAVLVNALAFDGDWKQKFDKGKTQNGTFTLEGGATVDVPFMSEHKLESSGAELDNGSVALEVPYVDEAFRLLLVLPPDGTSAAKHLSGLKAEALDEIRSNLMEGEIHVSLPKLRVEKETDLKEVLEKMGAGGLFVPGSDFSKIHNSPQTRDLAYISQAIHKTFLEWDEEGTKAAAATQMEVATKSAGPINAFIANRPFLYFLLHEPTGTILFIGVCNDPS